MIKCTRTDYTSKIYSIIQNIVCKSCGMKGTEVCEKHRQRCESMYNTEAEEIYENVIKPLEDKQ